MEYYGASFVLTDSVLLVHEVGREERRGCAEHRERQKGRERRETEMDDWRGRNVQGKGAGV
jgi:hypothetical protein